MEISISILQRSAVEAMMPELGFEKKEFSVILRGENEAQEGLKWYLVAMLRLGKLQVPWLSLGGSAWIENCAMSAILMPCT